MRDKLLINRLAEKAKASDAQAILEFALITPLLLLFLFGIVDFGWAMNNKVVTINAAREAARLAATGATVNQICDRAVAQSQDLITRANVTVQFIDVNGDDRLLPGDTVVVRISFLYRAITPLGELVGAPVLDGRVMKASTDMRLEQVARGATPGGPIQC
jgi:hypothetical protein